MRYTGVDVNKLYSIDYSPLRGEWKPTGRSGRKIYVVPSHLTYVRIGETEITDLHDLRRHLALEVEERFGNPLWDVRLSGNLYCLALVRDFEPPEDSYALDPEVFSLARVATALGEEDCFVLDLGRHKTTLVEVKGARLLSYRVVLKGGNFIDQLLSRELGLKAEEAERIRIEEGLKREAVRSAFERILESLGRDLSEEKVLLSGGLSRLRNIEEYFGTVLRNRYVDPELNSAFGAALKYVYRDCSPDFRGEELSHRDVKKIALVLSFSFLLFLGANLGLHLTEKRVLSGIRAVEKEKFREVFPGLPPMAVRDQVRSMVSAERYPLTEKLIKASGILKEGVKLYRIEYGNGVLRIVGEVSDKSVLEGTEARSLKKTPAGGYEFEVELR